MSDMSNPATTLTADHEARRRARRRLPPEARALLDRERVSFAEACEFLGYTRQAGHPKATRYLARVHKLTRSGKPFDVTKLRPECNGAGEYTEIPCYRASHRIMCRADLLVPMVYPEVGWPV